MNNLNSILIEGNLVKDPLIRTTTKGTQLCTMRIASNRYYKTDANSPYEKEVSYFEVDTWSKLAEACYSKARKGRGLRVVGRLKQSRWNDPDGKQHSKISIVAEHVEFHPESKKNGNSVSETVVDDSDNPFDDDYPSGVRVITEKELEPVVF